MDSPLPSPRLARKASSLPPALTPMLKTLGLEEDDPEDVFEIHSKEGAGAFGRVFRASYRSDPNRLAALKVIPVALEAGQRGEDIENVRREIQFLRECDHPNVVAFYGAYYKDHALWLAMEYCGGGSVGDVSRRRNLLEDEIAIITRGALHGLAYLHARKKIHRDIKGGNILLSSTGEVKIADFGVSAQLKDTMSRRGTFVGTPYWMSPEMIQDSDYDYKSDIWSLGITLIELADQKPPLFDEHPMRVLIQIPRNPPPSVKQPTAWSPLLSVFLQFCLRKDPKERPSAVDCLGHAFIQRVEAMPYVFAEGMEARRLAEAEAPAEADAAEGVADQAAAAEGNEKTAKSLQANSTSGRTMGSLTSTSARDSEVMADDVTLRARPSKLMIEQPPPAQTEEDFEAKADESIELERQILSHPSTEDDEAGVTTPRDRESVVDEVLKLSPTAARSMSPNSSCSEVDDDGESNDAAAEGFAFRHDPSATVAKKPPVEMVSGDELLQLSVDDSFEMPAMTLISKIQAAASTLAGQSTRPRVAALPIPVSPPLPLPLSSAPSPILKASRKGSVLDESRLPSPSSSSSDPPPPRPAAVIRRDLYSFSRTDSISRAVPPTGEENTSSRSGGWTNPLAQLTMPSHDRVNSLLSSLSASTSRLLLPPPQPLDVSTELDSRASLHSISRPSHPPPLSSSIQMTNSISSSSHNPFIGSPFRVSHPLNVTYNTVDAKFEGVPTNPEWMAVHQQFGLPLAHLKCRSNSTTPHVPALVQMLRRELFRRDGLHCKYIYRVSPEQSELQHAKQMIQRGAFDPTSVSDPHVFASLLKIWLRDLPVPLLGALRRSDLAAVVERLVSPDDRDVGSGGNDATREIVFAVAFPDVHAVVTTAVLAPLPTGERAVLLWLVDHMLEVISQSALNAMTAQSLTVVIAPNVFRWAATTPAEASAISKQVATLLRVLLAWRQRCRGGGGGERDGGASGERETCSLSVRSRTGKTEGTAAVHSLGASVSIRDSLNGLRLSLHGIPNSSVSRDSTVSSILRRSNLPVAASNHFVSASYSEDHCKSDESSSEPSVQRVVSLEMMLRDCVDGLWNELPLSIMLDDPPPIVRSLHAKFQRNMLSLIAEHARRPQERRWATERLETLEDKPKARLVEQDTTLNLPLSLRVYARWLHAVLEFKAFTALLQQERLVRDRLEKRWPTHSFTADSTSGSTVENAFAMSQLLVLAATDQHYNSSVQKTDETEQAMLDGAATYLRVLHQSLTSYGKETSTVMPLAEELVANGKQEPALGNLLVAMSRSYTSRYHLETYYRDIVAMVERSLQLDTRR